LAYQLEVPFLGEVPLIQSIREAGDVGHPAALQAQGPSVEAFTEVVQNMITSLTDRIENLPPTEAVRITTMAGCKTTPRNA
jgi:ATP-binding protein involved in chromosome partitioning